MPVFTASRWFPGNNNVVFPDRLEIDANNVSYFKGTVIGYHSVVLPRTGIASCRICSRLIFADIMIESTGGKGITARGFLKSDARAILKLLS